MKLSLWVKKEKANDNIFIQIKNVQIYMIKLKNVFLWQKI